MVSTIHNKRNLLYSRFSDYNVYALKRHNGNTGSVMTQQAMPCTLVRLVANGEVYFGVWYHREVYALICINRQIDSDNFTAGSVVEPSPLCS